KVVKALTIDAATINVSLELGYPAAGIKSEIQQALIDQIVPLAEGRKVQVDVDWTIAANDAQKDVENLTTVKNVIAVASGKGGVGKSTTAVNLALALVAEGASVGILDADIYGPSQSIMLGIEPGVRPEVKGEQFWMPIKAHGLQSMSMGYLVDENTAMVWRGPMAGSALQQMVNQTMWHDLDYLIVDMPPGTGDVQLTLSQKVPVAGALIVTTPQDIALLDARKGIEMFRKVEIPVLGVVENMSVHVCSECGHVEHLFGAGGGEAIATQYDTKLLASLPLNLSIREQADSGVPTVVADPDGSIAAIYRDLARKLAAELDKKNKTQGFKKPNIVMYSD
ncbi:MAG: iron-sulfur cluster carrier protein ApbC, partial [Pseudomonadales bacterium]|nr:iron-sulfur cluster carrier protein ApbC [Pseudomonadales bacterium]